MWLRCRYPTGGAGYECAGVTLGGSQVETVASAHLRETPVYAPYGYAAMCLPVPRCCCSPAERTAQWLPVLVWAAPIWRPARWSCAAPGAVVRLCRDGTVRINGLVINEKGEIEPLMYAVENGDYAVTDDVPRRLDAPENLVQSLRLLLTLPRQGYYPRPVGGVGGCGADLLPDELLALGRRAVCDVPGVLVLGCATTDGSAVFRLWVGEEEREVTGRPMRATYQEITDKMRGRHFSTLAAKRLARICRSWTPAFAVWQRSCMPCRCLATMCKARRLPIRHGVRIWIGTRRTWAYSARALLAAAGGRRHFRWRKQQRRR